MFLGDRTNTSNQRRPFVDRIFGKNEITPADLANEDAIAEDKERESQKSIEEWKKRERRWAEIKSMQDKNDAIFFEIAEFALPMLDIKTDEEIVYLETSGGLLRITKDRKGVVYIVGHESRLLTEIAQRLRERLAAEFPSREFRLG